MFPTSCSRALIPLSQLNYPVTEKGSGFRLLKSTGVFR